MDLLNSGILASATGKRSTTELTPCMIGAPAVRVCVTVRSYTAARPVLSENTPSIH